MTNEHLNTQLYWKLQREHTAFKNWLMHQPPGVIIENAYKYAMMEDVLLTFENNNLPDEQAKAASTRDASGRFTARIRKKLEE